MSQKTTLSAQDAGIYPGISRWQARICAGNVDGDIVQEGVPGIIPSEACYLGWQESLILLGKLVEAEVPDEP